MLRRFTLLQSTFHILPVYISSSYGLQLRLLGLTAQDLTDLGEGAASITYLIDVLYITTMKHALFYRHWLDFSGLNNNAGTSYIHANSLIFAIQYHKFWVRSRL